MQPKVGPKVNIKCPASMASAQTLSANRQSNFQRHDVTTAGYAWITFGNGCACTDPELRFPQALHSLRIGHLRRPLERTSDFLHLEDFELIAFLDVIIAAQRQPAFEPGLDLPDVVLKALEGI